MRKLTKKELLMVNKPVRYVGKEFNECIKNKDDVKVRICNAYSNLYEIGIKNKQYNDIYNILNLRKDTWCERAFLPYYDLFNIMQSKKIALQSIESKDFLKEFDIIHFNVNDVLEYSNVISMINLSYIDLYTNKRLKDKSPFVIATGEAINLNCLALSQFVDFFILGQPEEVLNTIVDKYINFKSQNLPKIEFLRSLKSVQGIYIPCLHKSNALIYGAKNSYDADLYNKLPLLVPNMYEVYEEEKYKVIDIFTNVSKIRYLFNIPAIENESIINTIKEYINYYKNVEIRFTIGLPSETYEVLNILSNLINDIVSSCKSILGSNKNNVKIVIDNFIIYPHTKLQWYNKNRLKDIENKQKFLIDNINKYIEDINVIFCDAKISTLKQILLFADENTFSILDQLIKHNILFYSSDKVNDVTSFEQIDLDKYQELLSRQELNYKFGFDNFILQGNEKIKLKKEYKEFMQKMIERNESYE